jgi:hypothetical protein
VKRAILLASLLSLFLPAPGTSGDPAISEYDPVFSFPVSMHDDALRHHPFVEHSKTTAVVRATFVQEKRIKALRRPLISSGGFLFSKQHGARWQTRKPFTNTVVITQDRLTQINRHGDVETFSSSRHPMMKAMTKVFTAMLAMDPDEVPQHFGVHARIQDATWTIGLVPREAKMRKLIHAIVLQGDGPHMTQLTMFEQYGDITSFRFGYENDRHALLTAGELAAFAPAP